MPTATRLPASSVAAATSAGSAAASAAGPAATAPEGKARAAGDVRFSDLFGLTLALAGGAGPAAAAGLTDPGAVAGVADPAGRAAAAVATLPVAPDGAARPAGASAGRAAGRDAKTRDGKADPDAAGAALVPLVNPLAAALAALPPAVPPRGKLPAPAEASRLQPAGIASARRTALPLVAAHDAAGGTAPAAAKIAAAGQLLPAPLPGHGTADDRGDAAALPGAAPAADPASAAAAGANLAVPTAARPPAQLVVQAPVQSPAWGPELGQKVVWMVGNQAPSAHLHLHPAHLGPVEVQLTVTGSQVNAVILAHHAQTREAIEAALPQLRATLADSGLSLGQAQVGAGGAQGGGGQSGAGQWSTPARPHAALVTPVRLDRQGPTLAGLASAGGVDTFA